MSERIWAEVAEEQQLEEGSPTVVEAHGRRILLLKRRGKVHAHTADCTHYGASLKRGMLSGDEVTCPWHHGRFDVCTGAAVAGPAYADLDEVPVKVESGRVFVGPPRRRTLRRPEGDDGRTFVIVGGGAGGHAAAESLRREGFAGRILMLTEDDAAPYDRTALSKGFLAGKTGAEELPLRGTDFYSEAGIEILTGHRATGLDPAGHRLSLANGESLAYDRVLLATGATPRRPDLPGADRKGCFVLRSLADGEAIRAAAERSETAAILGAGFIGLEVASALRQRGLEVHVIAPETIPLVNIFGEAIGRWLLELHREKGVHFHLGATARAIKGAKDVEGLELSDGSHVAADMVVVGIGVVPAVDWLQGTDLVRDGAVPVDARFRTGAPDIFAVGDIALLPAPPGGKPFRVEHWAVAQRQGRHAARNMLGSDEPYSEPTFFWTSQYNLTLIHIGDGTAADRIVVRGEIGPKGFLAGYYADDKLKAVATLGRTAESMALDALLRRGGSVRPEEFEDDSFDLVAAARMR